MKTAIILGAGHRSLGYAEYAEIAPDKLKIVGVADLLPDRRAYVAAKYGIGPEMCFASCAELVAAGRKLADCVINGTMDADHVPTTVPLLELGYDVLLEKPFALNMEELTTLDCVAQRTKRVVMICHVLRYAPFYAEIKKRVAAGAIGDIVDIQSAEHVSYHHFSSCFIRGKWNSRAKCGASFLLAKCCHDLDLITWLKSGVSPIRVASLGGRHIFRPGCAPAGAGNYCLLDCPIEATCDYSVRRLHLDSPVRWHTYIWPDLAYVSGLDTPENREKALRDPAHPFARCVWKCAESDQVDRQAVVLEFADGAIATHSMVGNMARPLRKLHLIGTEGEIEGCFEDNAFVVRRRDVRPGHEYAEEKIDFGAMGDASGAFGDHGGGDLRLVEDFVALLEGGKPSISCTVLADSIHGHQAVFLADLSREEKRMIEFPHC